MGKLPNAELKDLLKCVKKNPKVVIPPIPGFDSGVHMIDKETCLVVSTDPCIGVPEKWFGWLLIHYAASDVALFGARPEYCTITLLGPPSTKAATFTKIMNQICHVTEELNMTIITGHTGTYNGLSKLLGSCTAYGMVNRQKLITPGGAQTKDIIICTKQIGLETVINFIHTHPTLANTLFTHDRAHQLQNLMNMQTCVKEASLLTEIEGVHAMHDTTEGGLVAALNEMADSSNHGFTIDLKATQFVPEVEILKTHFNLSQHEVLSLSSTGTLLAAIAPEHRANATQELTKHGVNLRVIGTFTQKKTRLIKYENKTIAFPKVAEDPYSKIMRLQVRS